jgi:hypothetical protein
MTKVQCIETAIENNPNFVCSDEEKVYRIQGLLYIAMSNIGINQFDILEPWIEEHVKDGLSMGHSKDLARCYAKPASDFLVKQLRNIQLNAFNRVYCHEVCE